MLRAIQDSSSSAAHHASFLLAAAADGLDGDGGADGLDGVSASRKHVQEKEIGQYSYSKHCYLVLAAVEAVSAPVAPVAVRSRSQQE